MVNTPLNPVHAALHAAYVKAGSAETKKADEGGGLKGEELFAAAIKGATLQDICEATGLTMDQVQSMMAQIADHVMHRGLDPATGAAPLRATEIEFGLREHRQGMPGWKSGIPQYREG